MYKINRLQFVELKERVFYLSPLEKRINEQNILSEFYDKELTILMTPLIAFHEEQVDIPKNNYHEAILDYLRNGNSPGIIITPYLDRLIIETAKENLKQPRLFMQAGNELNEGFVYYRDKGMDMKDNELARIVNHIKPTSIILGGAYLSETEDELKKWDLEEFPFEYSADSGCFVGPIYLMFRDKYPILINENLVRRA
jgi:hypothetical protein